MYDTNGKTELSILTFSKERPLQLEGLLTSLESNLTGDWKVELVINAPNEAFKSAYKKVLKVHSQRIGSMVFEESAKEFQAATSRLLRQNRSPFVTFFVDDNLLIERLDVSDLTRLSRAGSFTTLRLGKNITRSMFSDVSTDQPALEDFESNNHTGSNAVFQWKFGDGGKNWRYLALEGLVLRRDQARKLLPLVRCPNPNLLEDKLNKPRFKSQFEQGIVFAKSKLLNLPVNRVQESRKNPVNSHEASTEYLLSLFERGFRLDASRYFGINNEILHADLPLELINPAGQVWPDTH